MRHNSELHGSKREAQAIDDFDNVSVGAAQTNRADLPKRDGSDRGRSNNMHTNNGAFVRVTKYETTTLNTVRLYVM